MANKRGLFVNISAAAFMMGAMTTMSHAAPPSGPRATLPGEKEFFNSLMAPSKKLESLKGYLFRIEAEDLGLSIIGNAYNDAGKHCCGISDCRYVQSKENPDGTYTVDLGNEFPSSRTREIIVPPEKFAVGKDASGYTPKSSVLCAAPNSTDLGLENQVYCFRAAGTLTQNNPENWLPFIRQREIAQRARQYVNLAP